MAAWGPAIDRVPDGRRIVELCLRLLRREGGGAYGDFDEQVRRDFALTPVTEQGFGRAGNG